MDHLRKVQSGQKLEIPAATFNSFVDAARDFKDRQRDKQSNAEPYFPDSGIILVANQSGQDRNRFDVLGVTEPIIRPEANLIEFKAPRTLRMVEYCNLFRKNNLPELALHVPNVFFVRGALSRQLAESANRWTEHLHSTHTHVLGRPLWSDQVGFTLAVAEMQLAPERLGFFRPVEVANWLDARRMDTHPRLVHFGARRWRRFWSRGKILGLMQ